jgi:hypothetical protein
MLLLTRYLFYYWAFPKKIVGPWNWFGNHPSAWRRAHGFCVLTYSCICTSNSAFCNHFSYLATSRLLSLGNVW